MRGSLETATPKIGKTPPLPPAKTATRSKLAIPEARKKNSNKKATTSQGTKAMTSGDRTRNETMSRIEHCDDSQHEAPEKDETPQATQT